MNSDQEEIDYDDDQEGSSDEMPSFIDEHNSIQLLGLIAALQLSPKNHGRNFRFELLAREVLLRFDPKDEKPLATWGKLKSIIEGFSEGAHMEDPLSNAFTEIAFFEEGNYVVGTGIYAGFTDLLNCIIQSTFLTENDLPKEFVQQVRSATGLLLLMSDMLFTEAGHKPYLFENGQTGNIEFPAYAEANKYTNANYFSIEFLQEECERRSYDFDILKEFLLTPGSPELQEEDPDKNVVNFKPLVKIENVILVYMPTAIVHALVAFIYQQAKDQELYDKLLAMVYDRQFDLVLRSLKKMNWARLDIRLPEPQNKLPIDEVVYRIDNQKLAYVCYLKPDDNGDLQGQFSVNAEPGQIQERTKEVINFLSTIEPKQPFSVFCLFILGEAGQEFSFSWSKAPANHLSLSLKCSELFTIACTDKVNTLTLWKFAKCYAQTSERMHISALGGVMDAYVIYLDNHGSLMDSDNENPIGGMMVYTYGNSNEFKREIQKKIHEHTVRIFHNGQLAYAIVTRYKQYAPIYIETELRKEFRLAIETYKMPIWIINQQALAKKNGWAGFMCEAIAFWLHKMEKHLSNAINQLTFIAFELDLVVEDKLLTAQEYERKEVRMDEVEIKYTVEAPRMKIEIPFDFLYLIKHPNNSADRLLMKSVLNGLIKYVNTAGKTIALDQDQIIAIIDEVMQPANAKMILFSDASLNVKMDNRNLPSVRYIHASDISFVLDNIVGYLPPGYVIPKKIADKKDKIQLCDDVVIAIAKKISEKIEKFNGPELLEWLIRANEKCIQEKEFREITVPARIACFSSEEDEIEKILDKDRNLVITAHALRTLIEFVATRIPEGTLWPNNDDIDELMALTNQLTEWGALNETMRMGLDDPEMGLLPSGRIGTEKTLEKEAFKPYAIAKTESDLFKHNEDFAETYAPKLSSVKAEKSDESKELDAAWLSETGITLTNMFRLIGEMINFGFQSGVSCAKLKESDLFEMLGKVKGITAKEIEATLSLLTLIERPAINIPPDTYQYSDIFPWRFNRVLSYLRRPLVRVPEAGEIYYFFGYRHLMVYIDNLLFLLQTAKYQNPISAELKAWIAAISGRKGNPFRKAVKEWFEANTDFEVIPHEIKMTPEKELKTDKPYGDIDLMVIDHTNKIIYCIECKNISGGRNVHEMKIEMDDYLGREGQEKKGKIFMHVERDKWLQKNRKSLLVFGEGMDTYEIRSLILTSDEIPLSYLRDDLTLPIRSFVFVRKKGIKILD
jgi:hypothetical protein